MRRLVGKIAGETEHGREGGGGGGWESRILGGRSCTWRRDGANFRWYQVRSRREPSFRKESSRHDMACKLSLITWKQFNLGEEYVDDNGKGE